MNIDRIQSYLSDFEEQAAVVMWHAQYLPGKTIFIVDKNRKLTGMYNADQTKVPYKDSLRYAQISEVCSKDVAYIVNSDSNTTNATLLFAQHPDISVLPIVDDSMKVIDIIYRFQCFYMEFYNSYKDNTPKCGTFPYPHYAHCIYETAKMAKLSGYTDISIIEFGVAGGNGLMACELHAQEIAKIFNVNISIYGFDTGKGLPRADDTRDVPERFADGDYVMNIELLQRKLRTAKLILGDIKDTAGRFFEEETPPPIGCMLIDVDYYSSTIPILNMLEADHKFFLPIIHMYFDDISAMEQFQGEALAIREFNERKLPIKISPEFFNWSLPKLFWRIKRCVRFDHPQYPYKSEKVHFPLVF